MRDAKRLNGCVGWVGRVLTAGALVAGLATSAQAQGLTVVGFDAVPSGAFSSYAEDGFLVTAAATNWTSFTYGGTPPRSIVFFDASGTISVSRPGSTFQFSAIDLYASVSAVPYTIRGFLGGQKVFELVGTNPYASGLFVTTASPSAAFIDQLTVTLTNAATHGGNPMGLDNITFGAIAAVPEPSTLMMGAFGLGAIAWRRRQARG